MKSYKNLDYLYYLIVYSEKNFNLEESKNHKGVLVDKEGRHYAEMIGNSNGGRMEYPEGHSLHQKEESLYKI